MAGNLAEEDMKGPWARDIFLVAMSGFLVIFFFACAFVPIISTPDHQLNSPRYRYIVKTTIDNCKALKGEYRSYYDDNRTVLVNCVLQPETKERKGKVEVRPLPWAEPPILASVYDYLFNAGTERRDYGLNSYILFPARSPRADHFLDELFKTTGYVVDNLIDLENLNVMYLPVVDPYLTSEIRGHAVLPVGPFETSRYNYPLARKILAQICAAPAEVIRDFCATDLSRGPYLFTYARPVSTLSQVPPPYLVVDLSDVHIRAFGEFISAYKAQVKRRDYPDRERIDALRLRVLNIILTAADWIAPTKSAIADILHMTKDEGGSKN